MNYAKIAKHNLHFKSNIIDQIGEHDIIYDCNFCVEIYKKEAIC